MGYIIRYRVPYTWDEYGWRMEQYYCEQCAKAAAEKYGTWVEPVLLIPAFGVDATTIPCTCPMGQAT